LPLWLVAGALLSLSACSSPPRGPATDPDASHDTPAAAESASEPESNYDLRDEGPFPPPADVRFEEDILDPPEDAEGESFEKSQVEEENLPEEAETPEKLPATVETPVAPSVGSRQEGVNPNTTPGYRVERGFRVQLIASSSHSEASKLANDAENRLRAPVYVQSEGALYKVRAGDFLDRAAAQELRARAQANGFPEAWVVSTEIHIPAD
jgi:cell division septation protein DedD